MNILIDIGHPAHVHLFKNFAKIMGDEHDIIFTCRKKEISEYLIKVYQLPYELRNKGYMPTLLKPISLINIVLQIIKLCKEKRIDLLLGGCGNAYVALAGRLMGIPSFLFDDTEHASLQLNLIRIFGTKIFTPTAYRISLGKKQICYNGYHELAYVHPNHFQPNPSILDELNIKEGEIFTIMRFVKWQASHDFSHTGMHEKLKILAVRMMSKYGKVFITSEDKLNAELEGNRIQIAPEKMHDALYYASLLFGESATMASESAALGTPAIYLDNDGRGYTDELEEKYGMVFNFTESLSDQQRAINCAEKILRDYDASYWISKRKNLLADKIDVTRFMIEAILNFAQQAGIRE